MNPTSTPAALQQSVDLGIFIDDCLSEIADTALAHNASVIYERPIAPSIEIAIDVGRLRQLLSTLIADVLVARESVRVSVSLSRECSDQGHDELRIIVNGDCVETAAGSERTPRADEPPPKRGTAASTQKLAGQLASVLGGTLIGGPAANGGKAYMFTLPAPSCEVAPRAGFAYRRAS